MIDFPLPQDTVAKTFRVPVRALLKARNDGTLHPSDLVHIPPNKLGYTPDAIRKLMAAGVISREFESLLPGQMVQSQTAYAVHHPRPAELLDPWEQPQRWQSPTGAELSALSQHLAELARPEETRTLSRPVGNYQGALFVNGDIHFHVHKRQRKAAQAPALPAVSQDMRSRLEWAAIAVLMLVCLGAMVQAFRPIVVQPILERRVPGEAY